MLKVIAATNRVDILDPALLRSGRLDRKIEFPHPNEEARARILQIHSRKMNVRYCRVMHMIKCCSYFLTTNIRQRGSRRSYTINIFSSCSKEVNFEELARCTDDFNGAQLKAVCVEAVSTYTCILIIYLIKYTLSSTDFIDRHITHQK